MVRILLMSTLLGGLATARAQTVLQHSLPDLQGAYTISTNREAQVSLPGAPLDVERAWLSVGGWGQPGLLQGDGVECEETEFLTILPRVHAFMPPQLPYWMAATGDLSGSFLVEIEFQSMFGANWHFLADGETSLRLSFSEPGSFCWQVAEAPVAYVDSVVLHVQLAETGVEPRPRHRELSLENPWPNPGNGAVNLAWDVPAGLPARLVLFDLGGVRLREWPAAAGGRRELVFDSSGLASGLYLLALETQDRRLVRRMAVVK